MLKVEVGQNLNENGFHHYIAYVDELPGRENPIILNLYTNLGGFVNLTSLNEEIHAQFGMENKEFMDYFYSRAGVKAIDCLSIKINGRPNFVYKNSHVYTSKAIFENITPEIIMRDSIEIKKDLSKNGEIDKDLITNFDNSLFGDTYDGENTKLNGSYCSFYLLPILFNFINLELGREALPISLANEFIDEFAYQEGNDDRENDEKQIPDDWVSDLVFKPDEIKDLCGDPKKSEEFCISRLNEILGIRLSSDRYTRNGMDAKDFTNKVIIEVKYKKSDSYNTFDRKFESDIKDIISKSPYAFKTFIYINLSPEVDFTSSFVPPPVEGILVFKASGADFKKYHAMTLRDSIETSKIHNKGTRSAGITATRDETIENKIEEYLQRKDNEQKLKEEEIAEEKSIEGRVIFNDKLETSSIESFRIVTKYLISRVPIADNPKFAEIQHTFEQFICDHSDLVLNKLLQIRPTMKSAFGLTSNRTREYKEIIDFITTTYKCNVSGKDFSGKIRAIEFTKLDALTMKDPRICGIPYGKSRDAEIRIADKKLSSYQTKPKVSSTILMEVEAISNLKIEDITPMDYIIHTGIQGSQASGNLICVLGMLVKYVKDNPSVKSIEDLDCKMCLQLKDSTDTNKYNIRRIYNNFLKNEKLHPVSMKIAEIIGENDLVYFNIRQGDDFVDDVAEMLRTCLNDRLSFSKVRVRFGGANGVSSLMGLYDAQCPSIENKGGRQVEITGNGEYRSFKLNFLNKRREILVATGSDVINQLRSLGLSKRLRNDGLRTEDALRMFDINNF